MKILVVTDSLGLPRKYPESLTEEQCWTHNFSLNNGCKVFLFSRKGLTTTNIVYELNNALGAYTPDVVILQVGIVDCTPRALTRKELKLIKILPIRALIHRFIKSNRSTIVTMRKKCYVDVSAFKANLLKVRDYFSSAKIYAIPILPATERYEKMNPGAKKNICKYNTIASDVFHMLDPYENIDIEQLVMEDQHHLNEKGHTYLLNYIESYFNNELC